MPIYRIRRYSGRKGGRNHYHHADVIARDSRTALRAAKGGRVTNWRWIDTFDTASHDYREYEFLYRIKDGFAKNPRRPLSMAEYRQKLVYLRAERVVEAVPGVARCFLDHPMRVEVWIRKGFRMNWSMLETALNPFVGERSVTHRRIG